jgi:hypothetical protein
LATAASTTFSITGVMSSPVPSPSMYGMTGSSGTFRDMSALTCDLLALAGHLDVLVHGKEAKAEKKEEKAMAKADKKEAKADAKAEKKTAKAEKKEEAKK